MSDGVDPLSSAGMSELANFVIRPPRAHYSRAELGDRDFVVDGVAAQRVDSTLINRRGFMLQASRYTPAHLSEDAPTVVYLHGNGSCRAEAAMLLPLTIPYGFSLFAFDFSGSGRSEGEYISLGVWERYDVATVVEHLVSVGVQSVVLWGHSMGAATALMYSGLDERSSCVKGLILDSPFSSFEKLAHFLVSEMRLPLGISRKLILSVGIRAVRKIVRERAGFDVMDIDPLSATKNIAASLPAIFIHGTLDAVVPFSHGQALFKQYPSPDKTWIPLEAFEHDTQRPESCMDHAHVFLQRVLPDFAPGSPQHLELLKARGNSAMLSGRFSDSIYVYTEALDALSQTLTDTSFAKAVGEPLSPSLQDGLPSRRNPAIASLFHSMRWRSRDDSSRPREPIRRASDELHKTYENNLADDTSQVNISPECSRSDSSGWSNRFARQKSFSAKGVLQIIKRRVRTGRAWRATSTDVETEQSTTNTAEPEDASSLPDIATTPSRRQNRSLSRTERSSARIRLRHTVKRETRHSQQRRSNAKHRASDNHEELRSSSTNISCFGRGFHKSDRPRKHLLRRSKQDSNSGRRDEYGMVGLGISDWDMNSEIKALALALLGNRSLARRRVGDIQGSLFDAVTSLQLDPSWIRGYLRKAAALREDGRLEQAKIVIMDGLKQDSNHAGLKDMLRSIEEAVEKEQMTAEEDKAEAKVCESDTQSLPSAVAGSC